MGNLILSQIPFDELLAGLRQIVKEEIETSGPVREPVAVKEVQKPVNTKELCEFLGLSPPTVVNLRRKKKIPFFFVGSHVRYDLAEVMKVLRKQAK